MSARRRTSSRFVCCPSLRLTSLALTVLVGPALAAAPKVPDPQRVAAVAAMLPKTPQGVGPTIGQREAWRAAAGHKAFAGTVAAARKQLAQPLPELTDDVYLDFSRTGNRTRGQKVIGARHDRIAELVLAECLENEGRFLPGIEATIRAVCEEKAWTLPAHDRSLKNFEGKERDIDLWVANTAWNLATADYWLGDKLSAAVRRLIRDELRKRVFDPFEGYVKDGRPRMFWPTTTNNWNAVCMAGTAGTALAILDSPQDRAFYVAAAETYIENFIAGFTADGYCSEGVGYWNYGFGHFLLLAETLHQATGGRIDLLTNPKVRAMALFARRLEISPGVFPAFADCHVGAQPDPTLTGFVMRRLGLPLRPEERSRLLLGVGPSHRLFEIGLFGFDNSAAAVPLAEGAGAAAPRDYFAEAGILICRAQAAGGAPFGAALKGGHNAEHHNHNDVGSFIVALGRETPLLDPGSEVYTARTFSGKRYDSQVLNSFGHPVPRIAGQLQRTGRDAAAKVLRADFSDECDTYALDIAAPYAVKSLQKLTRTFVFHRGRPSLEVTDEVAFDGPQTFETALITFGKWTQPVPDRLRFGEGAGAVEVQIDAGGQAFSIVAEEIKEDLGGRRVPTRLGIALKSPVAAARVRLTISPAAKK